MPRAVLHKRKNIVLLLGKMLCYVVNLTPLSSHLLIQKTFPHAVKFDIFKESQTVSAFTRNSLFHVPFRKAKGSECLQQTVLPKCQVYRAHPFSQLSFYYVSLFTVIWLFARSTSPAIGAENKLRTNAVTAIRNWAFFVQN